MNTQKKKQHVAHLLTEESAAAASEHISVAAASMASNSEISFRRLPSAARAVARR